MRKGILWMLVSFLLVAALALSSCGPAAPGEQEEEEEEEEEEPIVPGEQEEEEEEEEVVPAVGEPQYGGTITGFNESGDDPSTPDMAYGHYNPLFFLSPILEKPINGDFVKYGPRGTGEYEFRTRGFIPEAYLRGVLLESWEFFPDKAVWHVRPGIHWAPSEEQRAWMEPRELVAADIVADLIYFRDGAAGTAFRSLSGDIYATDKYTLVIEFVRFDPSTLMYVVGYEDRALISPPEMVKAGPDKWENQVGTGPFMFEEYVLGSHMSFVPNPNYWDTATINGVEYRLPFIDKLVYPIIPDKATRLAAMRTGTLDYWTRVQAVDYYALETTAPELLSGKVLGASGMVAALNTTVPPLDDVNVRRALEIGTNMEAICELMGVWPAPIHWYPAFHGNPGVYQPLEQLPADIRILYDYNPELATQMLADAGYPDGFEIAFAITPLELDWAALLKDQWTRIGVEVVIEVREPAVFAAIQEAREYQMLSDGGDPSNPIYELQRHGVTGHHMNTAIYSNEAFDELVGKIGGELDIGERNRMIKEAGLIILYDAPYIPLYPLGEAVFWWPWMRNFYGESYTSDTENATAIPHVWVDEAMKEDMGF